MTDGIIQKIFNMKRSQFSFNDENIIFNNSYYDKAVKNMLIEIEQELITEIKNNVNSYGFYGEIRAVPIEELIGDNQD